MYFVYSAANSINWGRLLPQVVYHASSYLDLVLRNVISMGDPVDLCIPTGNFGNIIAAYYAKVSVMYFISRFPLYSLIALCTCYYALFNVHALSSFSGNGHTLSKTNMCVKCE